MIDSDSNNTLSLAIKIYIKINIATQSLSLFKDEHLIQHYLIATAKKGTGEQQGSCQTPRGQHRIYSKIGDGLPANTVFVGRVPTGEIYTPELAAQYPDRDWILTRILQLEGMEEGRNRGGNVDSLARYIYIHGTPDGIPMGVPSSHGCIRMRNADLLILFESISLGDGVWIEA